VPDTGPALVHRGEVILPTGGPAEAFRAGAAGGGGPVNVTFQISAIDSRSGMQFVKSQASTISSVIARQIRNANRDLTSALTS
jgi:hypothetical protein